jgi:hypothetical protein
MYSCCEYTLLWLVQPLSCCPLPLPTHSPFLSSFQYTSSYALPSQMLYIMIYWCSTILLSFPFFPSSIEQFHCYEHVLHLSLCRIMLVFVHMFIFGSIFHIWEKTYGLCLSEPGLLHLMWCPPFASIYLQTTWCHSFLWLDTTALYIRITFSWSIHQL